MRSELPVFKRCCICLPLRYGLLTWGYIRAIIAVLVTIIAAILSFELFFAAVFYRRDLRYFIFSLLCAFWVVVSLTDIVLNILFIVAGHKKNLKLIKAYYVYSILLCVLTTVMAVAYSAYIFYLYCSDQQNLLYQIWFLLLDIAVIIIQILVQGYMILLVRSEIIKLRSNCQFRFVNNAGESECTMNGEEEITLGEEAKENNCEGNCESKGTCEFVRYVARNNEY